MAELTMENNKLRDTPGLKTLSKPAELPPATQKIDTDSEQDPDFNEEEFLRLRSSLHRHIDEAEARDRVGRRGTHPCRKIRKFFRRMFDTKATGVDGKSKDDSFIAVSALAQLVSPSSENQKLESSSTSVSSDSKTMIPPKKP